MIAVDFYHCVLVALRVALEEKLILGRVYYLAVCVRQRHGHDGRLVGDGPYRVLRERKRVAFIAFNGDVGRHFVFRRLRFSVPRYQFHFHIKHGKARQPRRYGNRPLCFVYIKAAHAVYSCRCVVFISLNRPFSGFAALVFTVGLDVCGYDCILVFAQDISCVIRHHGGDNSRFAAFFQYYDGGLNPGFVLLRIFSDVP